MLRVREKDLKQNILRDKRDRLEDMEKQYEANKAQRRPIKPPAKRPSLVVERPKISARDLYESDEESDWEDEEEEILPLPRSLPTQPTTRPVMPSRPVPVAPRPSVPVVNNNFDAAEAYTVDAYRRKMAEAKRSMLMSQVFG
jgi:hypothetical protein